MLHQTLLNTTSAVDMCAKLQPNSRLWPIEAGIRGGMTGNGIQGFTLRGLGGVIGNPSAKIAAISGMCASVNEFGNGSVLGVGGLRQAQSMRGTVARQFGSTGNTTYREFNGDFNRPNSSGKLSRRDGWPPPEALATTSGSGAGPGGGSTAAQ